MSTRRRLWHLAFADHGGGDHRRPGRARPSRASIAAAPTGSRRGPRRRGGPCSSGARRPATRQDLTPAPFNVRTRVHEYGGGAYAVRDGVIVAANFADQRLYRIDRRRGAASR